MAGTSRANAEETRAQNAFEYARGFNGLEAISIDGANFTESYEALEKVIETIRTERRPFLVHAKVPLLNHHTSGVRMEWYRDDLEEARSRDPYPVIEKTITRCRIFRYKTFYDIEKCREGRKYNQILKEALIRQKIQNLKIYLQTILYQHQLPRKKEHVRQKVQRK